MEGSDRAAGSRAGHADGRIDLDRGNERLGLDQRDGTLVHVELDPLLAAGLSDRPRYDAWSGEMRLALAVVEDAIMTIRMTNGVEAPRARRLGHEAWAWLVSGDTRHPFAFENLCDHLGLHAAWLRNGLRMSGCVQPAAPMATRRNRRRSTRVGRG